MSLMLCIALSAMFCSGIRCVRSVSATEEGQGRLWELAKRHNKSQF